MGIPLLGAAAVGFGGKALGSLFGKDKRKPSGDTENRYLRELAPQKQRADTAEDFYLDNIQDFDPSDAMREYGEAAYGDFRRNLDLDVERLGGQAVGAGRLDTGYYDLDQGELVSDMANRYQRAIASQAVNASGQRLRQLEGVGAYGQGSRNTYLDQLSGQMDRETGQANSKRRMWSDMLGAGAGAAATYMGSRG